MCIMHPVIVTVFDLTKIGMKRHNLSFNENRLAVCKLHAEIGMDRQTWLSLYAHFCNFYLQMRLKMYLSPISDVED